MMAHIKEYLKDWIIKTGENAVGKSIALGVYDPEIPDELKEAIFLIVKHEAVKNRTVIIMK